METRKTRFRAVLMISLFIPAAVMAGGSTEITGFVDASYFGNVDTKEETFGLDQAEIDVERAVEGLGFVRADIEFVKDGDDWVAAVEQGFLAYTPPFAERLTFTMGKFNAPIGFELLDAPDMYQYSHALVFDYTLPTNLTGAMIGADLGAGTDLVAYVVNGWDRNQETNGVKTFGARFGYAHGDLGAGGISAIRGSESEDQSDMRTVIDVDLMVTPVENLIVGGEANIGMVSISGEDLGWFGFLVMAHYDFTEVVGLTGRFDYLDDTDDFIFGSDLEETRTAFTIAPTFALGAGMGALVEVRIDNSSKDVFIDKDGEKDGSEMTVAFEMTYTF